MNIILLIIDTLRYDAVAANGNTRMRTPNMDRLAARSWIFDRAYAGSFPTIPHRTDVITGAYGAPFHQWKPLRFDQPLLPRMLADAGYATQLIHDTPHLVNGGHAFDWPFHAWTYVRGAEVDRPWIDDKGMPAFDHWAPDPVFDYVGTPDFGHNMNLFVTYSRANRHREQPEDWNVARLFQTASDFLRDNAKRENFFLWVDCFDPHEPWDAPPEFVQLYDRTPGYDGRIDPRSFLPDARDLGDQPFPPLAHARLQAFYDAKVSWADHNLGKFLDALDETGLARNTAVILTSDHGTNLGELGKFGKGVPVKEQEAHVPLFLALPDGGAGRCNAIVQPQDLFPTVLGLAGVETPTSLDGQDLRDIIVTGPDTEHRTVALSGLSLREWSADPGAVLFTVFGPEHYLHVTRAPGKRRLFAHGSLTDAATEHPDIVDDLYKAGLAELTRRGTDPRVLDWLQGEGETPPPDDCLPPVRPAGWQHYFFQNYDRW